MLSTSSSEVQTHLRLKLAPLVTFGCNFSKRRCAVDIQRGLPEQGVVENIRRIHTELHALTFADLESLADSRIESPGAWQFHRLLTQCPSLTGTSVLKYHLIRFGIRDCLECAVGAELRRKL